MISRIPYAADGVLLHLPPIDWWESIIEQRGLMPAFLKYSEDQPRDDRGRWTDGGGGDFSPEAEAAATAELDAFQAEMKSYGRQVAEQLGYDPNDIKFEEYNKAFAVGDQHFNEGGHYSPESGMITINLSSVNSKEDMLAILSHEIQHDRFKIVMEVYEAELGEMTSVHIRADGTLKPEYHAEFPTYAAIQPHWEGKWDTLKREDGVTDYSTAYWKASGQAGSNVTVKLATNETLAEMATLNQTTGVVPGSKAWQNLYRAINREAAKIKVRSAW